MHSDYEGAHFRESRRQQRMCACVCLWCGILTVAILLICITVGLRYSGSRDVLDYSSTVGDTRLVSYSPGLCSGGQMTTTSTSTNNPTGYSAGLYFLDQEPPLSTSNLLWLRGSFVISPAYVYDYDFYHYEYVGIVYAAWQFHLNPGSELTIGSCIAQITGGGANFLVLQGNHDYNRWLGNPYGVSGAFEAELTLCGGGQTTAYSFSITEDAEYYVIYYATSGEPQINLLLTINRTEYSVAKVSGMPNCTFVNDGSCTADSQSSTQYILFQTTSANGSNITHVQDLALEWNCYPRNGAYVAIFFFPLIVLALLFCGCFGIFLVCSRFCQRSKYSELAEDHTHVHAQPACEKPPPPYSAGTL